MSHVMSACEPPDIQSERSQFRQKSFINEPVRLQLSLDGININPTVEHLDGGEASFACSKYFDAFYEGQMIGPAVLALENDEMALVYPVVTSKNWPLIGVEFMQLSENDRRMIKTF